MTLFLYSGTLLATIKSRIMVADLKTLEEEQILQTIEMFEVIAQANPDDCQSLTLLKEAYQKLSRHGEVIRISELLGDAYSRIGHYEAAYEEYRSICHQVSHPEKIIEKLQSVGSALGVEVDAKAILEAASQTPINNDSSLDSSLISIEETQKNSVDIDYGPDYSLPEDDGNDMLARFLIQSGLAVDSFVQDSLKRVRAFNQNPDSSRIARSLLGELIAEVSQEDAEAVFCHILDHCRYGYIPIENYETDRKIVKMLPEEVTLGRLIVPFEIMSRTLMVAICNPFDAPGKEAVQRMLDYNIQWFFASPKGIQKVLSDVYRIPLEEQEGGDIE